jgi:hypothetical protein
LHFKGLFRYPAKNGVSSYANGTGVASALETGMLNKQNFKCQLANARAFPVPFAHLISFVFEGHKRKELDEIASHN